MTLAEIVERIDKADDWKTNYQKFVPKFIQEVCLAEWADLPYSQQTECPIENETIMNTLRGIAELNGGNFNGCWDVLAWKGDRIIFTESKRLKRDKIRDTQTRWLDAALRYGLKPENFLVVEWEGEIGNG